MTASSRDVFPLRFKNPRTRAALKHLSEQTGVPMTDVAERAIEHEVVVQGADLARRLEEALAVVRSYRPERDAAAYIAAAAEGERSGQDPFARVQGRGTHGVRSRTEVKLGEDPLGVIAAFGG